MILAAAVAVALTACGGTTSNGPNGSGPAVAMTVSSGAFEDGQAIPPEYTCDAGSQQLPVSWSGAPNNTAEFALVMTDPDANNFAHWVVVGIPADETALSNPLPEGAAAATNGKGQIGYTGPCPPSGTHHYVITVYALSGPLNLNSSATADQVRSAAANKILATGTLTGTYARAGAS